MIDCSYFLLSVLLCLSLNVVSDDRRLPFVISCGRGLGCDIPRGSGCSQPPWLALRPTRWLSCSRTNASENIITSWAISSWLISALFVQSCSGGIKITCGGMLQPPAIQNSGRVVWGWIPSPNVVLYMIFLTFSLDPRWFLQFMYLNLSFSVIVLAGICCVVSILDCDVFNMFISQILSAFCVIEIPLIYLFSFLWEHFFTWIYSFEKKFTITS